MLQALLLCVALVSLSEAAETTLGIPNAHLPAVLINILPDGGPTGKSALAFLKQVRL